MSTDYESLTYKIKFKRTCKKALVILIISAVVLAPALWCWDQSIQSRQTLREAKNVVRNMNLLALEYYGFDDPITDSGRVSGMSKKAESEVKDFSGVDGEIHLISWDTKKNCVTTMSYQKGRFLAEYRYDASKDASAWNIYWRIHQYDNEG